MKELGEAIKELCAEADEAGVATVSGTAFGQYGEGYLRFSVANSIENIKKALDRVATWANQNL